MTDVARPGAGKPARPKWTPGSLTHYHRYGCFDREPYPDFIEETVGQKVDPETWKVIPDTKYVEYPFAKDCQYAKTKLGAADKSCTDCIWNATNNPEGLADPGDA